MFREKNNPARFSINEKIESLQIASKPVTSGWFFGITRHVALAEKSNHPSTPNVHHRQSRLGLVRADRLRRQLRSFIVEALNYDDEKSETSGKAGGLR